MPTSHSKSKQKSTHKEEPYEINTSSKTDISKKASHNKSHSRRNDQNEEFESKRFTVEDIHDFAKIGGEILKRTVTTGFDVFKEVTDGLPKEASNLINKGKEEVLKGINREVMNNMITVGIDKFFAKVREHKVDVTLTFRLRKEEDTANNTKK